MPKKVYTLEEVKRILGDINDVEKDLVEYDIDTYEFTLWLEDDDI